ncbi:MAG: hypothetical protein IKR74_03235 [Bacilli bacterium]|nr:hypothetical protein [Bacilli bacterium]
MKLNKKASLIKLSKKQQLNIFDTARLFIMLTHLQNTDIDFVKIFLNNYYTSIDFPEDFYVLFMNYLHSYKYKELFNILLTKNIYDLIRFLKNIDVNAYEIEQLISPFDFYNLPNKHIKLIVDLLKSLDIKNDKLELKKMLASKAQWLLRKPCFGSEKEYIRIAIIMYLSVGLDNTIDILKGKYGTVDYDSIFYLFNNLNVKNASDDINKVFNNFLFGSKKDPNNNMRLMLEGRNLELFINFDYFYNTINCFIDKLGTKLNPSKVSILLKERYLAPELENPELSGDVLNDMLSSYYHKYGITESESEIIEKNLKAYNSKLKFKTKSSIISTKIPSEDGYIFDLLPLTDARNLVMGYRAGNCFRINGDAFMLFNNFLSNPHMRILAISTKEYKDFGMVLLMRNGNVLIAQGIELSKRIPNQITGEKLYNAVKKAINFIMLQMNNGQDEIVASIIGLSNNNTIPYNKKTLPFIINPILDNNHQFYNGIENYQGLLSLKDGKSINDIRLFEPDARYHEVNNTIYRRNKSTPINSAIYGKIEKILISLRYAKFKVTTEEEMARYYNDLLSKSELYTICTLNWFIMVFQDGTIDTFVNSDDPIVLKHYYSELLNVGYEIKNRKLIFTKNETSNNEHFLNTAESLDMNHRC